MKKKSNTLRHDSLHHDPIDRNEKGGMLWVQGQSRIDSEFKFKSSWMKTLEKIDLFWLTVPRDIVNHVKEDMGAEVGGHWLQWLSGSRVQWEMLLRLHSHSFSCGPNLWNSLCHVDVKSSHLNSHLFNFFLSLNYKILSKLMFSNMFKSKISSVPLLIVPTNCVFSST